MNIIYQPSIEDPMYNKSFGELGFEYKENGSILKPWRNQFPEPMDYFDKITVWFNGDQYYFHLLDKEVTVSNIASENSWLIKYNPYILTHESEKIMKNLCFDTQKNMEGRLKRISFDIITGVQPPEGVGCHPKCGVKLNCIYLELTNESWIYIRRDHPLITKKIDRKQVRFVDRLFFDAGEIYYMCKQPFGWFKIKPGEIPGLIPIFYDRWLNFWGGGDFVNYDPWEEE